MRKQQSSPKDGQNREREDQKYFDYTFKTIIIGESGVGKTSLLKRFDENTFDPRIAPTLGFSYAAKVIEVENIKIKLQIWDTAGQQKYRSITRGYYERSQGGIIAFSLNSLESFTYLREWIEEFKANVQVNIPFIIVGTKKDLEQERVVSKEQGESLAQNNGVLYFECSAKTGQNVAQTFQTLARLIKQNSIDKKLKESESSQTIKLKPPTKKWHEKCCQK